MAYHYNRQQKAEREISSNVQFAQEQVDFSKKKLTEVSTPIFKVISRAYGDDIADCVAEGTIRIGMPSELLIYSWGEAEDIKTTVYKTVKTERWYYGGYLNRLSNQKYRTEVILENGRIVGWKDLN